MSVVLGFYGPAVSDGGTGERAEAVLPEGAYPAQHAAFSMGRFYLITAVGGDAAATSRLMSRGQSRWPLPGTGKDGTRASGCFHAKRCVAQRETPKSLTAGPPNLTDAVTCIIGSIR